jgi:hypothetical protein
MFEFRWVLPSTPKPHEVVLEVHARSSWFGPKVLRLDGRPVYHRGFFSGIDCDFEHPDDPKANVDLRLVPDEAAGWTPQLSCAGRVLGEISGARPPCILKPPARLAVATGLTYLLMFMAGVMLPSILTVLEAIWGEGGFRPRPGYEPLRDLYPWGLPLAATAVCLLGFWNMRRWGVTALGLVILVEVVCILAFHASLSWTPIVWQAVLLGFGVASYRRMQ